MNKVQELQYEINCMHDSKGFKVTESEHSGPLFHVPSESALFPHLDDQGGLLSRTRNPQPDIWDTQCASGNVFASPPVNPSTSNPRILTPWDNPDTGRIPERTSTEQPVLKDSDGGEVAIPNPRFLGSSSTGSSVDLMEGRICY